MKAALFQVDVVLHMTPSGIIMLILFFPEIVFPCSGTTTVTAAITDGCYFEVGHYFEGFLTSIKNHVYQHHHIGHVGFLIAVGVGILLNEIVIFFPHNMIDQQHHVGHGDQTVAIHITQIGAYEVIVI